MYKFTNISVICFAALLQISESQASSVLFNHGTETNVRWLPGGLQYDDIFFSNASGLTDIALDSVTVGVRRIANAPAIGVNLYALSMTGTDKASMSGDLSKQVFLGSFDLGTQGASSSTVPLTLSSLSAVLDLNNNIMSGFGGIWIGMQFTGTNATDTNNGWRVVNTPTIGVGYSDVLGFDSGSGTVGIGAFGSPTPSNVYVDVSGTLIPEPSSIALLGLGIMGIISLAKRQRGISGVL